MFHCSRTYVFKNYSVAAPAVTVQSQSCSARLSTSQLTAMVWLIRATAAKTQPRLGDATLPLLQPQLSCATPPRLKPSLDLTV